MPRDAENADADAGDATEERGQLVIVVVRTGGFAGIRRGWEVHPDETEAGEWVELVERCPWDEPTPEQPGADRYVWIIRAELPDARREREIPDAALDGPWKTLVDAVRERAASR
ncbi:protealysin inhibitor emfourin [Microbacterium sp.]|uniref:protealysin inhibitor emfourin n=1 Tax=Microbacterium sp. TaxID=51671 RepID=UPI0028120993|nr:protealysin inhibitor emfourin [Microbacterium sp.]